MTTVEILRGAKVELAKRGLRKGSFFPRVWVVGGAPPDGPCCVRGACQAAAGNSDGDRGDVLLFLQAAVPIHRLSPEDFNDRRTTTIDDVQALLDRAIALAEGK